MSYIPNKLVQEVSTNSTARITTTGTIPDDDTIPQNTEGTEILTLAITPKSATNILEIVFTSSVMTNTGGSSTVALFQDTTAGALSSILTANLASDFSNIALRYRIVAGTTSSTTFKLRMGSNNAAIQYLNGDSSGRKYGGTASTYLTIKEYLP